MVLCFEDGFNPSESEYKRHQETLKSPGLKRDRSRQSFHQLLMFGAAKGMIYMFGGSSEVMMPTDSSDTKSPTLIFSGSLVGFAQKAAVS